MAATDHTFRADLEGLRGIAILLVVGYHAGVSWLAGGFVGVDLFFVLSGYFITGLLVRELDAQGELRLMDFYGRRSLRLLPSLLVVVWTTLALALWLFAPIDRAAVAGTARSVALSSSNVAFARQAVNYFSTADDPLLHTWSLAVEEQFYLVWPLLLLVAVLAAERRAGADAARTRRAMLLAIAAAGLASFAASLVVTSRAQPWAFFGLATRVWEFAAGAALVLLGRDTPPMSARGSAALQAFGLACLVAAVAAYDASTSYPGAAALLPVLGSAALLLGGRDRADGVISRALAARPLRWLGRLSYAWYLWHWPLIVLGGVLDQRIGVGGKLLWSGVALGLAWLTHRHVEERARSGWLGRLSPVRLSALAFVVSIGTALAAYGAMRTSERRAAQPDQRAYAAARRDRVEHTCWNDAAAAWTPRCEFGDRTSTTTVALLGDSHAEHWLAGLDRAGREHGWKVAPLVKGGCPVADLGATGGSSKHPRWRECARFREAMLRRIEERRPALVVLASWDHYVAADGRADAWHVSVEEWESGLRRTYERLTRAGLSVVVLRGIPHAGFDVPACLSRRAARLPFARECTFERRAAFIAPAVHAQASAARGLPLRVVDMNDGICTTSRCPVVRGRVILFTDDNHLTASFTRSLAPVLAERLRPSIAASPAARR